MLPNLEARWIPDAKIRDFLLAGTTPKGIERLKFFEGYGFHRTKWELLQVALLAHVEAATVTIARQDQFGTTFAAIGPLETPSGKRAAVRSFWLIRADDPRPQLTTAIPRGAWTPDRQGS